MATHPFAGAVKKKPTLKHRLAIWEMMLGTVYACNDAGEIKYFDYDWDGAREYAGVREDRDLRIFKSPVVGGRDAPRKGQIALYVLKEK